MSRYDPELQQRVGKITNLVILAAAAIFVLYKCTGLSKSKDERLMDCYIKNMKGQGEHMANAVEYNCKQKLGTEK